MNGTPKTLGLALMAAFALSAVAASVASAQTVGKLTSTGEVTLKGTETGGNPTPGGAYDNAFTNSLGKITCNGSTYTGHKVLTFKDTEDKKEHELLPLNSTTVTITPHYVNCQAHIAILGTRPATVTMNGCDYVLHIGETTGGVEGTYGVTTTIECPAGSPGIMIHIYKVTTPPHTELICTITVRGGQTITGAHLTHTTGAPHDIDLTGPFTNIHEEHEGSLCGVGTSNATTLDIELTIKGYNAGGTETPVTITH